MIGPSRSTLSPRLRRIECTPQGSYTNASLNGPDTLVLEWDGDEWTQVPSPGVSGLGASGFSFEDVHIVNDSDIWFGGGFNDGPCSDECPVMTRYDGADFDVHYLPQTPDSLAPHRIRAIDSLGPNEVWAAGASGGVDASAFGRTYVARWNGSEWSRVQPPEYGSDEILRDIIVIAPDDVWAVGDYNTDDLVTTPLYIHWDGSHWTRFEGPTFATALVARASDDIYGVSAYGLVHWDGESWNLLEALDWPQFGFRNLLGLTEVSDCQLLGAGFTSFGPTDVEPLVVDINAVIAPCPADLDGSGTVAVADLLLLLAAWGDQEPDLDGDGEVGTGDLLALLAAWGACPQ